MPIWDWSEMHANHDVLSPSKWIWFTFWVSVCWLAVRHKSLHRVVVQVLCQVFDIVIFLCELNVRGRWELAVLTKLDMYRVVVTLQWLLIAAIPTSRSRHWHRIVAKGPIQYLLLKIRWGFGSISACPTHTIWKSEKWLLYTWCLWVVWMPSVAWD